MTAAAETAKLAPMAEALKSFFSAKLVDDLGASIARVHPAFARAAFAKDAKRGLDALELLDRARLISRSLATHLPPRYEDALRIVLASLGPEHATDELEGVGMAPFFYMPHLIFVAEHGLEHFDLSMEAQRELTKRFTAEFSVRFFVDRYPDRTLAVLETWARDPNPHVRRLVSEGTRPRLPWAMRVKFLDDHPERLLPLLELLKDDPTTLVRRSVANHLNDLGKSRPALLVETCRRWLIDASSEREKLVAHALRSAIKRGDPGALSLAGHGEPARIAIAAPRFAPPRVRIGDKVKISFAITSRAKREQSLLIDLSVHFVKARGTSAKVFKVARVTLPAGGTVELSKVVSLAQHTTRTPYPGEHAVDVLVNGAPTRLGAFEVCAPTTRRATASR